jgi:pre-mRNA-splicing factor ATP-dependent RNA helicase DHX16
MDPRLSKAIIASEQYKCTEEVLTIVAMLQESGSLFFRPKDKRIQANQAHQNFVRPGGDHFTLLNVFNEWVETGFSISWSYENFVQIKSLNRVRDVRDQLSSLCERVEIVPESNVDSSDIIPIQKAILAGYFYNCGQLSRSGDSYKTFKTNQTIFIHPSSSLFNTQPPVRYINFYELVLTTKEYARSVMEFRPDWLLEVAPHAFNKKDIQDDTARMMPKQVKQ